jgi:glucose-6-phosphate 1-epimerase
MSTNIRTITHTASGASCKVHDFGACLLSYKTGGTDNRECLFVSRDAKLDGSKAVRGGIPLVFPHFGPDPNDQMPQHGFLRMNYWTVDESSMYDNDNAAGVTYTLDLKDVKQSRGGQWDSDTEYNCLCCYRIKVEKSKITTTLEIKNTGEKRFPFQTLLHTYYQVDDKSALDGNKCFVKGLEGKRNTVLGLFFQKLNLKYLTHLCQCCQLNLTLRVFDR